MVTFRNREGRREFLLKQFKCDLQNLSSEVTTQQNFFINPFKNMLTQKSDATERAHTHAVVNMVHAC